MIVEILYIIICILLATINAQIIKDGRKVNHALQGATHIIVALLCAKFISWVYLPLILLTARIWFNSALNYCRELPLFYVTPNPTSFTDKVEQKIFGKNGELPFFLYLAGWLICNVLIFVL